MIDKKTQLKLGKLIFLTFTKTLIKNYGASSVFTLSKILEERGVRPTKPKEEIKEKVHEIVKAKEEELDKLVKNERFVKTGLEQYLPLPTFKKPITKPVEFPKKVIAPPQPFFRGIKLTIPETKLPERFNYLKPFPTESKISLGKLDPLLQDPEVRIIECNGAEENIVVKGGMGEMKTSIILKEEEVDEVINHFATKTKIPAHEGVYKVAFGRFILMAIISEAIGSRFILKKMKRLQPPIPY